MATCTKPGGGKCWCRVSQALSFLPIHLSASIGTIGVVHPTLDHTCIACLDLLIWAIGWTFFNCNPRWRPSISSLIHWNSLLRNYMIRFSQGYPPASALFWLSPSWIIYNRSCGQESASFQNGKYNHCFCYLLKIITWNIYKHFWSNWHIKHL